MDGKELKFLISQGEGYNLEFKESFSDSMAKDICAFANANGGKILLGMSDEGQIKGIRATNRLSSQIYDMTRNLDPKIEISLEKITPQIIIISVPEGADKPYSVKGKFYLRYGPNSQQLKRDEIREFFQKEGLVLFDEKPNYGFNLKKDFNKGAFHTFLKLAKITPILETKKILDNLSLFKGKLIKNAGVLLFCRKITKFSQNATITCVLFQGKDKYKILDRKEFDEDLYSNYQSVFNYLQSKLNTEYIIRGGPREERLELPESALREALLNAIAHRNYFLNANIQIYIFSNRIEITNPGGLVAGMRFTDLGKKSMPRNFLLFGLMQRMDLVEKVGSGILRINEAMKEYGLRKPEIEADTNWFTIIFKRPDLQKESYEKRKTFQKTREKTGEKTREKIIQLIKESPKITTKDLSEKTGLSIKGIEWNLKKLKSENALRRVGPDKGGYWEA